MLIHHRPNRSAELDSLPSGTPTTRLAHHTRLSTNTAQNPSTLRRPTTHPRRQSWVDANLATCPWNKVHVSAEQRRHGRTNTRHSPHPISSPIPGRDHTRASRAPKAPAAPRTRHAISKPTERQNTSQVGKNIKRFDWPSMDAQVKGPLFCRC